jgi:hypothetical protein
MDARDGEPNGAHEREFLVNLSSYVPNLKRT